MDCCCPSDLDNGSPAGGGGGASSDSYPEPVERQTTDDTLQSLTIATLPAAGAKVSYELTALAFSASGELIGYFKMWASAARNAVGMGANQAGQLGPSGSTDPGATPWTNAGAYPFGPINAIAFSGNLVLFQFTGLAATVVNWTFQIIRALSGGATP